MCVRVCVCDGGTVGNGIICMIFFFDNFNSHTSHYFIFIFIYCVVNFEFSGINVLFYIDTIPDNH